MYGKKEFVYVYADKMIMPQNVAKEHFVFSAELKDLVRLIKKKYQLSDVQTRFDMSKMNTFDIVLFNGAHGTDDEQVDRVNQKPMEFLKSFSTRAVHKEEADHSYWSNSVVNIERNQLNKILEGLRALPTPIEAVKPRMIAKGL